MQFNRQRFLCGASAVSLSFTSMMRALQVDAAASNTILVVLYLSGGNDGFNTVIPLGQYGAYIGLRPRIGVLQSDIAAAGTAFDANTVTSAATATTYAFHPKMTALRAKYAQGNLAVLMGGALPPTAPGLRSHPNAQFAWLTGAIDKYLATTIGWAGAAIDQFSPLTASIASMISVSGNLPILFGSKQSSALSFAGTLEGFKQPFPANQLAADLVTQAQDNTNLQNYSTADAATERVRGISSSTSIAVGKVAQLAGQVTALDYTTKFTNSAGATGASNLKTQLQQIARLILAGNDSKAYHASLGGFDSHSAQLTSQPDLLKLLSEATSEFMDYLAAKNPATAQSVILMTASEFGRTPRENATAGTDHGSSSMHFCMGAKIKGGVYGAYPSLLAKDLDSNGYAAVSYDYRNYVADIIATMGADPVPIVGKSYPKLGFV